MVTNATSTEITVAQAAQWHRVTTGVDRCREIHQELTEIRDQQDRLLNHLLLEEVSSETKKLNCLTVLRRKPILTFEYR